MQQIEQEQVERISEGERSISVDVERGATVDADGLQQSLAEVADTFDVTGFKCVKCGLTHMHDTMKHRLSDTFDISGEDSSSMDYNPTCHCGLQEAGRVGSEYGIDEGSAADKAGNAPIPPETSREMDEQLGSL